MELETDNVKEQLLDVREALGQVQAALKPLKLTAAKDASLPPRTSKLDLFCKDENLAPLDKAKLLVTLSYAIDALLFCILKVGGTDTTEHVILRELERIKQYVGKIKSAVARQKRQEQAAAGESGATNNKSSVDKDAAGRMIGHALSGNAAHERDRALRVARQNGKLQERLATAGQEAAEAYTVGKHTRFANSQLANEEARPSTAAASQAAEEDEDMLQVHDDEDEPGAAGEGLFDEGKDEARKRARRERRTVKKERLKKSKEKKQRQKQ